MAGRAEACSAHTVTVEHTNPTNIIETAHFALRETQNLQIQRLISRSGTIHSSRAKLCARLDR
jgi:hypothetical protein